MNELKDKIVSYFVDNKILYANFIINIIAQEIFTKRGYEAIIYPNYINDRALKRSFVNSYLDIDGNIIDFQLEVAKHLTPAITQVIEKGIITYTKVPLFPVEEKSNLPILMYKLKNRTLWTKPLKGYQNQLADINKWRRELN